jgi:DNA-binding NarL/FixJ family response regulator
VLCKGYRAASLPGRGRYLGMSSSGSRSERPSRGVSRETTELALICARSDAAEAVSSAVVQHGFRASVFIDADSFLAAPDASGTRGVLVWVGRNEAAATDAVQSLTRSRPELALVMIYATVERRSVRAALAAGASGVVHADELDSTLGPCVKAALAGQTCVPLGLWRQIDPPVLSAREKQILGLVVMGYMNSQIAGQLFLAESTIKSHLSSAFAKLGVRSRHEATSLILDPERGLGMGILSLVGDAESVEATPAGAR